MQPDSSDARSSQLMVNRKEERTTRERGRLDGDARAYYVRGIGGNQGLLTAQ